MKRLTLRRNRSDEAFITMLKNWSDEAFNALSLSTLYISIEKSPKNRAKLSNTYERQRRLCFSALLRKIRKITNFGGNYHWESLLHRSYSLIFFFVEALRQWWQIREVMKRWNRYYGKKFKQWSDEAFIAGKEMEAMNRSTLHRFYFPALAIANYVLHL